jgi:hypothetical protein
MAEVVKLVAEVVKLVEFSPHSTSTVFALPGF